MTPPMRRSGAVSPSALASARTVPVRMPGTAAGTTSLAVTSQRDAPTPYPASRMALGTARSASDDVMMTIGRIRTPSVSIAATRLRPLPTSSAASRATNTDSPRSP